ncbi:MAG: hypothetical protein FJY65_08370 [Calditrichaeota bacterium]|nr:hypothetical protein [Calditrichota bacterium]
MLVNILPVSALFAETTDTLNTGLGLSFGMVSGCGFCIKRIEEHKLGYHGSLLYWKVGDFSASFFAANVNSA